VYEDEDGETVDDCPWPGVAECKEKGWYCVEWPKGPGKEHPFGRNFWPCTEDYPGAMEDLNRLAVFNARGGKDPYEANTLVLGA
jgi:hypothetical protein